MARIFASAPDMPGGEGEILGTREEVQAVMQMQQHTRGFLRLRAQVKSATRIQALYRGAAFRTAQGRAREEVAASVVAAVVGAAVTAVAAVDLPPPPQGGQQQESPGQSSTTDAPFTIRNLDTGEEIAIAMAGDGQVGGAVDPELVRSKLNFGTIQQNSGAWKALKNESRGLLEKLASKTTINFRSYQLCVWQERYVFAEDDALCYQHLSSDMQPSGELKRIPYSSIEFVGPFDDTQFVVKTSQRAYTFLCESFESRTRWIKNISQLAGCSASTQVCYKTTTMGH